MMNEKKIWDYLIGKGLTPAGTAGLMGNLYAESALSPTNLQNSYEKSLDMTDAEYTAAVDNGSYKRFAKDSAGYGLAQWTYHTRKAALLAFCKAAGASIGDLAAQLDFLYKELSERYSGVLEALKTASSVRAASDLVLTKFERPRDMSEKVKAKRAGYGQKYYDRFAGGETVENYDKYIHSTGTHYIANSGKDENNAYHGGKAGDQTGHEFELKKWYSRPWTVILRYPDAAVALLIARLGCAAALNDRIGYDQDQRGTYWAQLQKAGYDPSKITVACEEDCTAGVSANVKAAGALLGIKALENLPLCSSRNMKQAFVKAGFVALTASKYLTGPEHLYPGDVLLCENHHAATNVTCGKSVRGEWEKALDNPSEPVPQGLSRGDHGGAVTAMQTALLAWDATCLPRYGADGDFGSETEKAVKAFQEAEGLPVTGVYDEATRKALTAPANDDAVGAISGSPAHDSGTDDSELSDDPIPPLEPTGKYIEIVQIHVRSAPGVQYMSLGTVQPGYRLPYQGETHKDDMGVPWYLVEYDGQNGWVSSAVGEVTE